MINDIKKPDIYNKSVRIGGHAVYYDKLLKRCEIYKRFS